MSCCGSFIVGAWDSSMGSPKMEAKSVRNMEIRGAGMLSVGAKTMPTDTVVSI